MKIKRFQLTEVVVPARTDSVHSPGYEKPLHMLSYGGKQAWTVEFHEIPKTVIELHTDKGIVGLGEAYRGLEIEQLVPVARQLLGLNLYNLNWQALPLPEGRPYDGFECAILDAIGQCVDLPLYALLGGCYRNRVKCSYWTGHRSIEDAARKSREGQKAGFDCLKMKCDLEDPVIDWCQAIHESCGENFKIILDPNQRWRNVATTLYLARKLAKIGNVLCLEDPIPRWDFEEYQHLRQQCPIPIALHIALPYREMGQLPQDVIRAIRNHACDYFNFNGGFFSLKRMAETAALAGISFWHGSEVDLGILESSYVHKAAACEAATLPSDIFGRLIREHDLLSDPLRFEDAHVFVPEGPGLGVKLDKDALNNYMKRTQEIASD